MRKAVCGSGVTTRWSNTNLKRWRRELEQKSRIVARSGCLIERSGRNAKRSGIDVVTALQRFRCIEGQRRRELASAPHSNVTLRAFTRVHFGAVWNVTRQAFVADSAVGCPDVERLIPPVGVAPGSRA
jgi:hypothetical protein